MGIGVSPFIEEADQSKNVGTTIDKLDKELKEMSKMQERVAISRKQVLLKREEVRTATSRIEAANNEARNLEASFMNTIRQTYLQNAGSLPETMIETYEKLETLRSTLGVAQEDQAERQSTLVGMEWAFNDEEEELYQFQIEEILEILKAIKSFVTQRSNTCRPLYPPPPPPFFKAPVSLNGSPLEQSTPLEQWLEQPVFQDQQHRPKHTKKHRRKSELSRPKIQIPRAQATYSRACTESAVSLIRESLSTKARIGAWLFDYLKDSPFHVLLYRSMLETYLSHDDMQSDEQVTERAAQFWDYDISSSEPEPTVQDDATPTSETRDRPRLSDDTATTSFVWNPELDEDVAQELVLEDVEETLPWTDTLSIYKEESNFLYDKAASQQTSESAMSQAGDNGTPNQHILRERTTSPSLRVTSPPQAGTDGSQTPPTEHSYRSEIHVSPPRVDSCLGLTNMGQSQPVVSTTLFDDAFQNKHVAVCPPRSCPPTKSHSSGQSHQREGAYSRQADDASMVSESNVKGVEHYDEVTFDPLLTDGSIGRMLGTCFRKMYIAPL